MRLLILLLSCTALAGCLERRVSITSEPSGALVTANDVELGRTPLDADFTYYGTYDVLVQLDGYEPLRTKAKASTPFYEYPPIDLATAAIPASVESVTRWHFKLEPTLESKIAPKEMEEQVLSRARALRDQE